MAHANKVRLLQDKENACPMNVTYTSPNATGRGDSKLSTVNRIRWLSRVALMKQGRLGGAGGGGVLCAVGEGEVEGAGRNLRGVGSTLKTSLYARGVGIDIEQHTCTTGSFRVTGK